MATRPLRTRFRRRCPVVVLVVVLAAVPGGLAAQPSQPSPVFRGGVELVTIDVTIVGRDSAPVEGLTAEDFLVTVDGAPRRVRSFRFVRADSAEGGAPAPRETVPAAGTVPAPAAGRTIVLVIDRDHIPAGGGRPFLEAAARFVDRLAPSDRVGLWTLPVVATEVQFVGDREQLKRLLLSAVGTAPTPRSTILLSPDEAFAIASLRDTRVRQEVFQRECVEKLANGSPASDPTWCSRQLDTEAFQTVRTLEASSAMTLASLERVVRGLAPLEGAKQVVLVTMGSYVLPDRLQEVRRLGETAAAARVHLHALQVSNALEPVRVDVAGPASLPLSNQAASAEFVLAGVTGGMALTTTAGEAAFSRLGRELSASYLLGIETETGDRDGKAHRLEVRVVGRGGLTVRARQQFRVDRTVVSAPAGVTTPAPVSPPAESPPPVTPETAPAGTSVVAATMPDVLDRLAAYVDRFEREFASVVAEERYVQLVRPWRGNPKSPQDEPALEWTESGQRVRSAGPVIARRTLLSDLLLVQVPGQQWLGYRDVAVVDDRAVRDRVDRVRDLFLSKAADRDDQLRRVADESARYNLGTFKRNLNVPTLALSFMHRRQQRRFEFTRAGEESVNGARVWVVRYRERARPTLVGTASGADVPLEGRLWIDPATGRVVQTEVRLQAYSQRRTSIQVRYRSEPRLDVLVPEYMWEWYEGGDALGRVMSDRTLIECLARYVNFRRFTVETTETVR